MSRLNKRPTVTGTPATKTRVRERTPDTARLIQPKVHMPRDPSDKEEFARFTASLNSQFNVISDQLAQLRTGTVIPGDYVRKDELADLIEEQDLHDDQLMTSEGGDELEPKARKKKTSRKRRRADDLAEAAIVNASPIVVPPNVAAVSSIGSVNADGQIRFSYQDHTHGGIVGGVPNSGSAGQILFYTSTFEVDGDDALFWDNAAAKLRVGPVGNRIIVNYIRSKIMGIPMQAGTNAARDFAYRRTFMSPRGVGAV